MPLLISIETQMYTFLTRHKGRDEKIEFSLNLKPRLACFCFIPKLNNNNFISLLLDEQLSFILSTSTVSSKIRFMYRLTLLSQVSCSLPPPSQNQNIVSMDFALVFSGMKRKCCHKWGMMGNQKR